MMLFWYCIVATAFLVYGFCPDKPGSCPKPTGPGICVDDCENDSCCEGDLKCCWNGCGHTCEQPIPPPEKPGSCPIKKLPAGFDRICEADCETDFDCEGDKKCCLYECTPFCEYECACPGDNICCSNECGRECVKPVL